MSTQLARKPSRSTVISGSGAAAGAAPSPVLTRRPSESMVKRPSSARLGSAEAAPNESGKRALEWTFHDSSHVRFIDSFLRL